MRLSESPRYAQAFSYINGKKAQFTLSQKGRLLGFTATAVDIYAEIEMTLTQKSEKSFGDKPSIL